MVYCIIFLAEVRVTGILNLDFFCREAAAGFESHCLRLAFSGFAPCVCFDVNEKQVCG